MKCVEDGFWSLVGLFLFVSGACMLGLGCWITETRYQRLAVYHGAASWCATQDGSVEFKWNDEKGK